MNLDDDFNLGDFNFDDLNIDELSLVPMAPAAAPLAAKPAKPKAKFQIDTRHSERRCSADRRQTIRFEDDRRKGDRRGSSVGDPWAKTVDF
ncbi:hypothetical protein P3W53_25685 [Pseudomonas denitrificans (nom. rej.)]|nr:hypothetical protein [Pseudomonas denitrificans (nom. rej.)]